MLDALRATVQHGTFGGDAQRAASRKLRPRTCRVTHAAYMPRGIDRLVAAFSLRDMRRPYGHAASSVHRRQRPHQRYEPAPLQCPRHCRRQANGGAALDCDARKLNLAVPMGDVLYIESERLGESGRWAQCGRQDFAAAGNGTRHSPRGDLLAEAATGTWQAARVRPGSQPQAANERSYAAA